MLTRAEILAFLAEVQADDVTVDEARKRLEMIVHLKKRQEANRKHSEAQDREYRAMIKHRSY